MLVLIAVPGVSGRRGCSGVDNNAADVGVEAGDEFVSLLLQPWSAFDRWLISLLLPS